MRRRKNFLPTLLLALIFWGVTGYIIFYIPPASLLSVFCFLFFVFCSLFLTLSLFLANARRGFLLSTGIVIFLFLRFLKIANLLTILLLVSSLTALEIYFRR